MKPDNLLKIRSFLVATDRAYDPETHMWVLDVAPGRVRCGFDPLESETSGDIVAVAFEPLSKEVARGAEFGSLEAAKFVGPLVAPVAGTLVAHNTAVLADPGLLNQDPLSHWLIEIELAAERSSLTGLLEGPEEIRTWFEAEVERFERQGALAQGALAQGAPGQ